MRHAECGKDCGFATYQSLIEAGYDPSDDSPTCRWCHMPLRGVMIDFVDDTEVAYS